MDKPLRQIDHIMWDMEVPTSLVTVSGLMTFTEKLHRKTVVKVIGERLLQYDKFRQKVVMVGQQPTWTDDEDFDLLAHIHRVALPGKGSYAELQELISDLMAVPLDYSKPLWQVHIIENYEGGSAILWRIHHAIADGIALIKVVFSLTGTSAEDSLCPVEHAHVSTPEKLNSLERLRLKLNHFMHVGEEVYKEAAHLLKSPGELKDTLVSSWHATKELVGLVTDPSKIGSKYKGKLGVVKKAAWSDAVELERVKAIGKILNATVNDVLLAAMTGAIRKHLIHHGEPVSEHFRVVCPVNFRKGEKIHVENSIGMISLGLPVHIGNPAERIVEVNRLTSRMKRSMEPAAVFSLLNIAGDYLPKKLERAAAAHIGNRIMGVLSNVPGPRETIYFAGLPVSDIMFWIPQTSVLGVGISIISYNGRVRLGVATDAHLIDDPDFIMKSFMEEFDEMSRQILG